MGLSGKQILLFGSYNLHFLIGNHIYLMETEQLGILT
jgi:hypothetical protein